MKLLSTLILFVSMQAFASGDIVTKTGAGKISVRGLHCMVNTWPGRTERTVLKNQTLMPLIISSTSEIIKLKHKALSAEGCDESLINPIFDISRMSFMFADVGVEVLISVVKIRTDSHCFDRVKEVLNVKFITGLILSSEEYNQVVPENCLP